MSPAAPQSAPAQSVSVPGGSPMIGILLKVASVSVFVTMSTLIKASGEGVPAGQIVFFRSAFAIVPILVFLALRGQLETAWRTASPLSHVRRGLVGVSAMGLGFYGIMRLPLPDAIAIGYAMPLLTVVFAALFLGEKVRIFRWSAVAVGLGGVLVISWPRLSLFGDGFGSGEAQGAIAVLCSAALGATAMILVRKLVLTEKTPTIVLYFSLTATVLSLASLPFGWIVPDWSTLGLMALAGFCGGLGQILLTQSYRHAEVSTIAPFEYTSIVLGILIGYFIFGDVPTWSMLIGTAIVIGAGLFVILREHRLGLKRKAQRKLVTPQG
ncbi:DMT family transporter [uncultured Hoeflea sp.]|uniref:DMT family transporter n=1 Tax=uncultured Hoeflea sp. TaxID=538666 RepID=UPI0030EB4170